MNFRPLAGTATPRRIAGIVLAHRDAYIAIISFQFRSFLAAYGQTGKKSVP
jgi:hypothetical protein